MRLPFERGNRCPKAVHDPKQSVPAYLTLHAALAPGLVDSLGPRMEMNVHQQPRIESGAKRQQAACQINRNSIDKIPHQMSQPDVDLAHQRQWRQEMLAKLPIRRPRRAFAIEFKRKGVDQNGTQAHELDVEAAAILQGHPARKSPALNIQGSQCRRLELTEAPFIGIGDKLNSIRLDDLVGMSRIRRRDLDLAVRNQ